MAKIKFFDLRIFKKFLNYVSVLTTILSLILMFVDISTDCKLEIGGAVLIILIFTYLVLWYRANNLQKVNLNVEGTTVVIKVGNIFEQSGLKTIGFNEYLDTQVDDRIISKRSLNGIFIDKYLSCSVTELDNHIENYSFDSKEIIKENSTRKFGKKIRYSIGTICVYEDYLLTAFSKFDEENKAGLSMPEYLEFLINFWDKVNKVYAQQDVLVPIFGSGITRIKGHKNIADEDLLKIMLWTFRISEMKFKYPAKLTVLIHKDKIDRINLFEIESARNGL